MDNMSQPHRRILALTCVLSRALGWAMIAAGVFGMGVLMFMGWGIGVTFGVPRLLREAVDVLGFFAMGLAVLGVVQFIRYALEDHTEVRWLLRKGHLVLGSIAVLMLMSWGISDWPNAWRVLHQLLDRPSNLMMPMGRPLLVVLVLGSSFLPALTKALCFVGLAVLLRTVLPVMEESKTLA